MILGSATFTSVAASVDNPLWLRNPAISPDASKIAFTYKGDIYTVPVKGGQATRLTSGSYNTAPVWSPDGKSIAFASDREGSLDVFIIDTTGGTPVRLTTHSGNETPRAFLNDTTIIISTRMLPSKESANGNYLGVTYTVSTTPQSRPRLFMSLPVGAVSVKGDKLLYEDKKGYEDSFRKHERSSGTSDIWLLSLGENDNPRDGKFTKLTTFNGHDLSPVWNGNGQDQFYYVSEEDGTLNIYSSNIDGSNKKQLTQFTTHPVRSLSASADGSTLAFSRDGELYTMKPGQAATVVPVKITADLYQPAVNKSVETGGATDIAVSPDGEQIAFVMHGNVYVTSKDYATTKQITNTPEQERVVDFSPDGKTLVYDSERNGLWQLFTAKVKNPDEDSFVYATEIVEEPLYIGSSPAFQPSFSPDGKKVAFLEGRTELKVIDLDTKAVNTALDGKYNYSYTDGDVSFEWSPDSRWFLTSYIGQGGWNNIDVALVAADGSEVHDLTNSGYSDGNAHWAMNGKAMVWESDKQGYRSHGSWGAESDIYVMFFDGEAYDRFMMNEEEAKLQDKQKEKSDENKDTEKDKKGKGKKDKEEKDAKDEKVEPLEFDLANAPYRIVRLTNSSSNLGDFYLDKKGENLYYGSDGDLWHKKIRKKDNKVMAKGMGRGGFVTDKDENALYTLGWRGDISAVSVPDGEVESIDFKAPLDYKAAAERAYIYDHVWRQTKEKFYDENLHGVDWDMYKGEYEKFLPHINNNYDFAELLSEFLGELNASHTGSRYYAPGAKMSTADLGAFYDESWDGDGLKIDEVILMGPLSTKDANIQPGEIITAINGETIKAGKDYYPMLEGKSGEKVRLTVKGLDGKDRDVYVRPTVSVSNNLYRRWVEHNRHIVDSVSGGRVGYVHVSGMNSQSFRTAYEEMLGRHRNCDAIIVDTRFNGGGWLHNDLAVLLSGKEYTRFTPRGQYIGSEPFSQWYKPSVMLVNEANYSDGYGGPFAYQTLGLGDVVGSPIPGTMTAVWWENQVDPSLIFGIPQVTNATVDGTPLENKQLDPDVVIYNQPGEIINGTDTQLIGATNHLLKKLAGEKK